MRCETWICGKRDVLMMTTDRWEDLQSFCNTIYDFENPRRDATARLRRGDGAGERDFVRRHGWFLRPWVAQGQE